MGYERFSGHHFESNTLTKCREAPQADSGALCDVTNLQKQAPDDSHHRMLALSNRSLNQSTIFLRLYLIDEKKR